jgi:hypothetical protein
MSVHSPTLMSSPTIEPLFGVCFEVSVHVLSQPSNPSCCSFSARKTTQMTTAQACGLQCMRCLPCHPYVPACLTCRLPLPRSPRPVLCGGEGCACRRVSHSELASAPVELLTPSMVAAYRDVVAVGSHAHPHIHVFKLALSRCVSLHRCSILANLQRWPRAAARAVHPACRRAPRAARAAGCREPGPRAGALRPKKGLLPLPVITPGGRGLCGCPGPRCGRAAEPASYRSSQVSSPPAPHCRTAPAEDEAPESAWSPCPTHHCLSDTTPCLEPPPPPLLLPPPACTSLVTYHKPLDIASNRGLCQQPIRSLGDAGPGIAGNANGTAGSAGGHGGWPRLWFWPKTEN